MSNTPSTLDPRTPVVVAVGQVEQRTDDPAAALEPVALLADAARAAEADTGGRGILGSVDTVAVIRIVSWRYHDPAALVAAQLGIDPCRTIETDDGGNYPQTLLNRACREIAAGASDGWLIGGAETWRNRSAGPDHGWTVQDSEVAPTEEVRNAEKLFHPGELAHRIVMPVDIYPMFDNALRATEGWTVDDHRDRIADLWSGFSEVAANNPNAWIQRTFTPGDIRDPSPTNRMVSFPYTKLMCSNNAVEQAAAFVVTSVERARALGIPSDRWVFPWSGTDAHEHWFISHRRSLAEAPAIGIAGRAALDLAGVDVDELDHVDVYSCFPSAVQIAAREIGLDLGRPLTVTGGLSFAGGPWNNYVSHSIATMVDRLRAEPGSLGLVTANGGYLTKHAFGVYSTEPPPQPFRHANLQDEVDRTPRRELASEVDSPVTVETSTVTHDREGNPERAILSTLLPDGRRAWAITSDPVAMKEIETAETGGRPGHVSPDASFEFEA